MNKKNEETLSQWERLGEVIFACLMVLLFAFFAKHQTANTGFFTEEFGALEMLCLYTPIIVGITPLVVRAWTGKRNPARLLQVITSLVLSLGSIWLLLLFPFDYRHLADVLPTALRFLLTWVSGDIARLILLIQIIVGPFTAVPTLWKYWTVRNEDTYLYFTRQSF